MSQTQSNGRILIVDDNEMNIDLLENLLGRQKYEVFTAMNGPDALELAPEIMPEIVLLDINMPMMSGYEVCEHLKADERVADVPVIFISAMSDLNNIVKGFDVGGVDYITKPFKAKEVMVRVESQLQVYRARKEIEKMRERDRQQFELIDEMRQRFIGSATHDLKNPLFLVAGYLSMMKTIPEVTKNEDAVQFMDAIQRGVDKMQGLIFDMLDLLQIEQVNVLAYVEVDFVSFVSDGVRDMHLKADAKMQEFVVTMPEESVNIRVDRNRMARVLDNLVSNAIKYTPENGRIEVRGTILDDAVSIEFIDNGLGIPEGKIDELFMPFERVRTKEHMAQEGSGLGLSIVKAVVEQHKGEITVDSELGEGSIFRVLLPRS